MNLAIEVICRLYLRSVLSLQHLRDWLALYQWDLSDYDTNLATDLNVVLVHFDDGHIDEVSLRARIAEFLERRSLPYVRLDLVDEEFITLQKTRHPITASTGHTVSVVATIA